MFASTCVWYWILGERSLIKWKQSRLFPLLIAKCKPRSLGIIKFQLYYKHKQISTTCYWDTKDWCTSRRIHKSHQEMWKWTLSRICLKKTKNYDVCQRQYKMIHNTFQKLKGPLAFAFFKVFTWVVQYLNGYKMKVVTIKCWCWRCKGSFPVLPQASIASQSTALRQNVKSATCSQLSFLMYCTVL